MLVASAIARILPTNALVKSMSLTGPRPGRRMSRAVPSGEISAFAALRLERPLRLGDAVEQELAQPERVFQ